MLVLLLLNYQVTVAAFSVVIHFARNWRPCAPANVSDMHISICLLFMQEVGVHVMAPAEVLLEDPLPHAVAVQPLREVATASQNGGHSLPPGTDRFAVTIDGTETEEEVASLKSGEAVMALLNIAPGVSRVHASRRIFELLQRHEIDISVIHFRRWACLLLPFPTEKKEKETPHLSALCNYQDLAL